MKHIEQIITTVEVAEMMNIPHKAILQKLEGANRGGKHTKGVIETLARLNFQPSDFFAESTYEDASGKTNKCYNCTRKGCEFLAHKFQGEKGIRFTAAYINRFHDMEQAITQVAVESKQKPKLTPEEIVDWKLNDLHKRVKALEKTDKPKIPLLTRLTPKKNTWYQKNRNRIWRIRHDKDMELRELYHIILEECEKCYDLDEAERIYRDRNGSAPTYTIELVEYFPELQEIANQVLDCFEK